MVLEAVLALVGFPAQESRQPVQERAGFRMGMAEKTEAEVRLRLVQGL